MPATLTPQEKQSIQAKLSDPKWRIANLYYIKDKSGNKVLFKPNKEQQEVMDNFWWFNIIPKARQLGITTFFCIFYLDAILFSSNKTAVIIAHTREHARKIFREKIKFAWDNMEPWVKELIGEPQTDTAQEMIFPNGSNISVTTSARSGTVQYLHISEFGYTCAHFPDKAREIVTGSINTVQAGEGVVSIESTAEGKEGYFYEFCMNAKRAAEENRPLSPLEFKLFFFGWWGHPEYTLPNSKVVITDEYDTYFKKLEQEIKQELTDGQKRWYIVKHRTNREHMYAEYPSTLREAFQASLQGAYYATQMQKVYEDGRIRNVPYLYDVPVDTWWDLGLNDSNVIVFTQTVGRAVHVIDVYSNSGESLSHYYNVLKDKGYHYDTHHLPHDAEHRDLSTGISRVQFLYDLGLTSIRTAPKLKIHDGIEALRAKFSQLYFDEKKTEPLYNALAAYRKEFDAKKGVFKDKPRHDENSHYADAMRVFGVLWQDPGIMQEDDDWGRPKYQEENSFFG